MSNTHLVILDYTNGNTIIVKDPELANGDDYDEWINEHYGNIDYYYMVGNSLNIEL
jgi:hypothetical protein